MINRHSPYSPHRLPDLALALVATAAASLSIAGCGEEEAPPPPPIVAAPPPPPPPPPLPQIKTIAELMQELGIDPRVKLSYFDAPATTENPAPASPACAASIAAFIARRFV